MNYNRIYQSIIDRARTRNLYGYSERHHVVPRCMGGSDEAINIVELTPREHYLCHKILAKLHPTNPKLVYALWRMSNSVNGGFRCSSNDYQSARLRFRAAHSNWMTLRWEDSEYRMETIRAIQSHQATDECRMRKSAVMSNRHAVAGYTEDLLSRARAKIVDRDDTRKRNMENWADPEYRQARVETMIQYHSDPTNKETHRAAILRTQVVLTCPHCGKVGKRSGMKVHHFDRCKKRI